MKHAFLIIAHQEFPVLQALIRLLDQESHTLFIHVDRRAQALYEAVQSIQPRKAELHLLAHRLPVYWGDISQVEVEYLLLETATVHDTYDYYHLLSGVDLPIQPLHTLHAFFSQHAGREFVGFWNSPAHAKDLKRKIERYYFFTQHRRPGEKWHAWTTPLFNLLLLAQKALGIRRKQKVFFRKGPQWFSITSHCCRYVLSQKAWVLKRFRHTLCPDEIFLQTLLYNSPFRNCIYNEQEDAQGTQRKIDWTKGNPYIWQEGDFEELVQSGLLFARKFSSQTPQLIQRLIDYVENEA